MDAGADFVSVVCILELMQCLSQAIARKAVGKGTTKQTSAAFESEDLKKYENRGNHLFPTHDCLDAQLLTRPSGHSAKIKQTSAVTCN